VDFVLSGKAKKLLVRLGRLFRHEKIGGSVLGCGDIFRIVMEPQPKLKRF